MWISYSHEPWNVTLPLATGAKVTASTTPPAGYIVPPQWTHVIDVLAAHDVTLRRTTAAWTGKVERYRCSGMQWQARPFEGRHPIFAGEDGGRAARPLRPMHAHHGDHDLPRRFGRGPARPAALQGRHSLAGARRARLRPALGLLRRNL